MIILYSCWYADPRGTWKRLHAKIVKAEATRTRDEHHNFFYDSLIYFPCGVRQPRHRVKLQRFQSMKYIYNEKNIIWSAFFLLFCKKQRKQKMNASQLRTSKDKDTNRLTEKRIKYIFNFANAIFLFCLLILPASTELSTEYWVLSFDSAHFFLSTFRPPLSLSLFLESMDLHFEAIVMVKVLSTLTTL